MAQSEHDPRIDYIEFPVPDIHDCAEPWRLKPGETLH